MSTAINSAEDRWSPQRKSTLLLAIDYQLISAGEAAGRYALSAEELDGWRRDFGAHGWPGLRATRLQIYHRKRS